MRRIVTIRIISASLALLFSAFTVRAQVENFDFLRAGTADGMKILQAYVSPWANAFGAGVNGSWYNTAKVHKFGGFDITLGTNFGLVPSSARFYDVSKLGLTGFTGTGMAPTVAGPDNDGPVLTSVSAGGLTPISFTLPSGTNWKIMPVPTLTAGIGLPLGTELRVRYIPKVSVNAGSLSSWGVGLVHSIMQYIPGEKLLPFDVSLFGGFTRMTTNVGLNLQPDPDLPQNYSAAYPAGAFDNQNLEGIVDAWNISVIGSFNLPVISFYGGAGYGKTKTTVNLTGSFPLPTVNTDISTTTFVYEDAGVIKNFPKMEIKNYSGLRTNIGFRIKLAALTLHADYCWSQYSVISTGLGISFR